MGYWNFIVKKLTVKRFVSVNSQSENSFFFYFSRSFPGDHLLIKKPEDSRYEIASSLEI